MCLYAKQAIGFASQTQVQCVTEASEMNLANMNIRYNMHLSHFIFLHLTLARSIDSQFYSDLLKLIDTFERTDCNVDFNQLHCCCFQMGLSNLACLRVYRSTQL